MLPACAAGPRLPDALGRHELVDVPFFAQSEFDCGPAALATVLAHDDVAVTAEELLSAVYVEALQGSLQAELMAASRRYGRIPYRIEPDVQALLEELGDGRPVLVLQNLGLPRLPIWHYAVVVGFDAERERIVLRSGTERRRIVKARRFFNTWRRADHWGIVVAQPGSVPATAAPQPYMRAVVDAERLLDDEAARAAYAGAVSRWPGDATVLFTAASKHQAHGRLEDAEALYRRLLVYAPEHAAARNNLAHVLHERGCTAQALEQARAALAAARPEDPLYAAISETVEEIGAAAGPAPAACP